MQVPSVNLSTVPRVARSMRSLPLVPLAYARNTETSPELAAVHKESSAPHLDVTLHAIWTTALSVLAVNALEEIQATFPAFNAPHQTVNEVVL
ncbi:UNVERIFIED_CONTAM: hypothetical protein NCL1_08251 [Trichonephila clavipes]